MYKGCSLVYAQQYISTRDVAFYLWHYVPTLDIYLYI